MRAAPPEQEETFVLLSAIHVWVQGGLAEIRNPGLFVQPKSQLPAHRLKARNVIARGEAR